MEVLNNEKFQCFKCVKKTTEIIREKGMGCTGKYPLVRKTDFGTLTVCPGNFFSSSHVNLLQIHTLFRKGIFGGEGGFLDQSSKYIEVMNLMERIVSKKEIDQAELLKKQRKNNGKRE